VARAASAFRFGRRALDAIDIEFLRLFARREADGSALLTSWQLRHSGLRLCLAVRNSLRTRRYRSQTYERQTGMSANIIFVHDDPQFIERAAAALRLAGHKVATFQEPMEALNALDTALFEILITRVPEEQTLRFFRPVPVRSYRPFSPPACPLASAAL
jgi:hypothetical protein